MGIFDQLKPPDVVSPSPSPSTPTPIAEKQNACTKYDDILYILEDVDLSPLGEDEDSVRVKLHVNKAIRILRKFQHEERMKK